MTGKSTRLFLAGLVLLFAVPGPAGAQGVGDASGPPCADIANTTLGYSSNFTSVLLLVDFPTPICGSGSNVTYHAVLYTTMGTENPDSVTVRDAGLSLLYEWRVTPTDVHLLQEVCSEAVTKVSSHPADYSPDRSTPEVPSRLQCTYPGAPVSSTRFG